MMHYFVNYMFFCILFVGALTQFPSKIFRTWCTWTMFPIATVFFSSRTTAVALNFFDIIQVMGAMPSTVGGRPGCRKVRKITIERSSNVRSFLKNDFLELNISVFH